MDGKTLCILACPRCGFRLIALKYLWKYHFPQNASGRRPILRMMVANAFREPQATASARPWLQAVTWPTPEALYANTLNGAYTFRL